MKGNGYFATKEGLKTFSKVLAFLIIILLIICATLYLHYHVPTERFRETSPDGQYTVIITSIGSPGRPRNEVLKIEMNCKSNPHCRDPLYVDISYSGFPEVTNATSYDIEWLSFGAKITLDNNIQSEEVYILPF